MKNKFLQSIFLAVALAGTLFAAETRTPNRPANHSVRGTLPPLSDVSPGKKRPPLRLTVSATHALDLVGENSSMERCSKRAGTFWTLNDSGNSPHIFAIDSAGNVLRPPNAGADYRGILLAGRRNIDWEALASDGAGNLVIADIGNNECNRRNLCFYIVPEPSPFAEKTEPSRKIGFYYPTQDFFPDPSKNYDAEACFVINGQIYFLTKHWTNTQTVLWRVNPQRDDYQPAVPVSRFNVLGLVTDAALSPSGNRLAVLTYHSVWIFDMPEKSANGTRDETKFFASPHFRKIAPPMKHWQIEGIVFEDEETLLISSESGALFRVPVKEIL